MNNVVEKFKKGSKIHIKESQKGTFTKYCGGNVTSECIQRGKNSPDPKIRKKATFAANARKWKHKDGGKAFVNGVSILDSNPDAYKYVKRKMKKAAGGTKLNNETIQTIGKTALNGILGFIQTSAQNNNLQKQADALKAQNKVQPEDFGSMMDQEVNQEIQNEMEQAAAIKAMTGQTINVNPDMARNKVWKRVAENYSRQKKAIDDQNKAIDAQVEAQKQSTWGNLAGGLIQSGIGLLGNYLGNKTSTNSNNSGAGWTMNYNSQYGNKNNYNTVFQTGSLPKMSSVVAPNTSWLNNNPL